MPDLSNLIFDESVHFFDRALAIYNFQKNNNPVYNEFIKSVGKENLEINSIEQIPFMPVSFFKTHPVVTNFIPSSKTLLFESSATTGNTVSKHWVHQPEIYETSLIKSFEHFFGDIKEYRFLALLPGYLERSNSSLVYMMNQLMRISKQNNNGFYLHNYNQLLEVIKSIHENDKKTILIGLTAALIDFADFIATNNAKHYLKNILVMETGGMKGLKKEMVKEELHLYLKNKFSIDSVYSEYGMTELLSQAYSKKNGVFITPPQMQILIREMNDPFSYCKDGQTGGINVIDLANLYSCSFIATQDLGKKQADGSFELLGRFDFSDIRGCNLMIN